VLLAVWLRRNLCMCPLRAGIAACDPDHAAFAGSLVIQAADGSGYVPVDWPPTDGSSSSGGGGTQPPLSLEGGQQRCFKQMFVCHNGLNITKWPLHGLGLLLVDHYRTHRQHMEQREGGPQELAALDAAAAASVATQAALAAEAGAAAAAARAARGITVIPAAAATVRAGSGSCASSSIAAAAQTASC
jgi:hypothetical protein